MHLCQFQTKRLLNEPDEILKNKIKNGHTHAPQVIECILA